MRLRQYVRNSVYVVCNIFFFGCNGYSLVTIGLSMVAFIHDSITKLNVAHRCILTSFRPVTFYCHSLHNIIIK